jgi:hypothetical protein
LLVQPAVQQPPSIRGIEEVTIAVVERALESSLKGDQSAKDDPVTNGAAVGAVIGAAAAVTVMVIAAKDGGWGPDQDGLALMIVPPAVQVRWSAQASTRGWSGRRRQV